ncbi:hypothetical protein N9M41_01950 [Rhodopirellula sp.]|jgi:hypothetical protein|nr:hypothetical protein [Rhodopirellula sp.]
MHFCNLTQQQRGIARTFALATAISLVIANVGCMGLATLMHVAGVDMIPAEYDELKHKTVAIVALTESSQYSNDVASRELSRFIGQILTTEVKDIQLVREDKIDQWRDVHGWDQINFDEIGKGVGADKVIGIEIANLRLRDGATLYRGRADVVVSVIDSETGNVEYSRSLEEFTYPNLAGQYTSETTESKFRKLYLRMLAEEVARSFHRYDLTDRIAEDSQIASF